MFDAKEFLETSSEVRQIFYGDGYVCQDVEYYNYDTYISDNSNNNDILENALMSKGIKLLVSQTGSGKTKALTDSAKRVCNNDKDLLIVFALPSRPLTEQLCENYNITKLVGGDNFDNKTQIVAVTYEKMFSIKEELERQRINGKDKKAILILDECHLLASQHLFRQQAIQDMIDCIESNLFFSVLLITATPNPVSLFHCNKILCFESTNNKPVMSKIKIIETDDVISYIKDSIDYDEEFPFIRLNDINIIEKLESDMPQRVAKITSKNKSNNKFYLDIVNNSKLDNANADLCLCTSLLEAGVSICDFPSNTVPIACFANKYISCDDVEQFLSRLRRNTNCFVKEARIVLKKPKEKELSAKLVSTDRSEICAFQDLSFHEGKLTINDTDILNSVADGNYIMKILIDDMSYTRKFYVGSTGNTKEYFYSKADKREISMQIFVFRPFIDILKTNLSKVERFCAILESYTTVLQQAKANRQTANNNSDDDLFFNEDELVISMILGAISNSEFADCISYNTKENKIKVNKRILYMQSYNQYQSQYYYFHHALKIELQNRINVPVEIVEEESTSKTKLSAKKKDDNIWNGIEDVKMYIENKGADGTLYKHIMNGSSLERIKKYKEELTKIREQEHLMQLMKNMSDVGVSDQYILKILVSSENQKDVSKKVKYYHFISMNRYLTNVSVMDIKDVPVANDEHRMQVSIYYYLNKKGQDYYTLKSKDKNKDNELLKEIYDFYKQSYPTAKKKYTPLQIRKLIMNMYQVKDKYKVKNKLKTEFRF